MVGSIHTAYEPALTTRRLHDQRMSSANGPGWECRVPDTDWLVTIIVIGELVTALLNLCHELFSHTDDQDRYPPEVNLRVVTA